MCWRSVIYLCILVSILSESHCRNFPPPGTVPGNNLPLSGTVPDGNLPHPGPVPYDNLPHPGPVPDNNLSLPRSVLDALARFNIVSLLDSLVYGSSGDMNSAGLSLDTLGKGNIL